MALSAYLASRMLLFARAVANAHKQALATPYPPSSKPGQYPRRRTGNLKRSTVVRPISVSEIQRTGKVSVGFLDRAYYGEILEYEMGRTGLGATIEKIIGSRVAGGRLPKGINWIRMPYQNL